MSVNLAKVTFPNKSISPRILSVGSPHEMKEIAEALRNQLPDRIIRDHGKTVEISEKDENGNYHITYWKRL